MVIGEAGDERGADLIDVALHPVAGVGSALVGHVLTNNYLCELSHAGRVGQTGVAKHDQTDITVGALHQLGELAVGLEVGVAHVERRTVDFVVSRRVERGARPKTLR